MVYKLPVPKFHENLPTDFELYYSPKMAVKWYLTCERCNDECIRYSILPFTYRVL